MAANPSPQTWQTSRRWSATETVFAAFTTLYLFIAFARIWCCLGYFPNEQWNDVRLRPSFLIADGLPLYPGLDQGPITSWLYGPALPLLMMPATLASHIEAALLFAGSWNAILLASAVFVTCLAWPASSIGTWSRTVRLCAAACTLLLLPEPFFAFLQADNVALAASLLSMTCLALAQTRGSGWWPAAFFASTAAFAKLHGFGLIVGEICWLWFAVSRAAALRQSGRIAVTVAAWTLATLWVSTSPLAAWDSWVTLPAHLPFTTDLGQRVTQHAPYYALMVVLPLVLAIVVIRCPYALRRPLSLPLLLWLSSLPLGFAGSLTVGGSFNSLYGAFLLFPPILTTFIATAAESKNFRRWNTAGLYCVLGLILAWQIQNMRRLPKTINISVPRDAVQLCSQQPKSLWLPWHPLATRFATGRHDNDEDGLWVRQLTGLFPTRAHVYAHLPPVWDHTVLQTNSLHWGVALAMQPTPVSVEQVGNWLVYAPAVRFSGSSDKPGSPP